MGRRNAPPRHRKSGDSNRKNDGRIHLLKIIGAVWRGERGRVKLEGLPRKSLRRNLGNHSIITLPIACLHGSMVHREESMLAVYSTQLSLPLPGTSCPRNQGGGGQSQLWHRHSNELFGIFGYQRGSLVQQQLHLDQRWSTSFERWVLRIQSRRVDD